MTWKSKIVSQPDIIFAQLTHSDIRQIIIFGFLKSYFFLVLFWYIFGIFPVQNFFLPPYGQCELMSRAWEAGGIGLDAIPRSQIERVNNSMHCNISIMGQAGENNSILNDFVCFPSMSYVCLPNLHDCIWLVIIKFHDK